ncbi:acylphosphatase [Ornithinimicrobium cryptoxanthini]|uniref:acylphosphatase n=1 Tax=Ornithinimicrobium cryptoxanthini TaxID=2934161 RepID=A0ABY4YEJ1_9MICO|nr:acylphosphatase [Ornithinimicrobium cryptoxanthini]USQ75206.1 acylphosphatase [Ornithinimicrobium cryptoxanthini]
MVRAVVFVRGRVQGVGFRWWTRARALELGLVGHARNLPDGRVEVNAQGPDDAVRALIDLLGEETSLRSRPGHVLGITVQWHEPVDSLTGFRER